MTFPHVTLPPGWMQSSGSLVSISNHIGSLGGYGSRGHYMNTGSLGDQSRPMALYHLAGLKLEHLEHEEIVGLYVKCVELLAGHEEK